jgi:two-component sensor histidine kinase
MNPVLRYSYMIEGIDKDWNIITEGKIRISGLPYGNFNLRIRAQSSDGSWSKSELNIPVIVRKPFYMSWWFTLSVLVILGSLVYGYIEFRTRNLQKTKMLLEKTVEDRTQQLKGLVSQKDLMMKEIHHRVKNNLQVISGLLELQKARSSDDQVKAALVESQNRVLSIAFIHQNLYQHEDLKGVQIKGFVEELTQHIKSLFRKESCIVTAELDIDNIFIDIDTAVPLGLIINELLTNSFKYAFPDRNNGHISIHIHRTAEHIYKMRYHDNGIGLPIGINTDKPKSLGMRLINRLSKQLDGDMVYTFEGGSCFSLIFKDSELRNNT